MASIIDAKDSPLAKDLFKVGGINSLMFGNDFVSVTKDVFKYCLLLGKFCMGSYKL